MHFLAFLERYISSVTDKDAVLNLLPSIPGRMNRLTEATRNTGDHVKYPVCGPIPRMEKMDSILYAGGSREEVDRLVESSEFVSSGTESRLYTRRFHIHLTHMLQYARHSPLGLDHCAQLSDFFRLGSPLRYCS